MEHAWPSWWRNIIPGGNTLGYVESQIITSEGAKTYGQRQSQAVRREVPAVCQVHCNGGWMSDLEGAIWPILVSLVQGQSRQLSEADQKMLAFWSHRTAQMLQFTHPA